MLVVVLMSVLVVCVKLLRLYVMKVWKFSKSVFVVSVVLFCCVLRCVNYLKVLSRYSVCRKML